MSYFDDDKNVDAYLAMIEGYDGAEQVAVLARHLPAGAAVLELGMGGGKDLDLLQQAGYVATGSDASEVFLRRYRERGGRCPTVQLDARTIEIEQRFDAVYSNKVLQHLTRPEMAASLRRQADVVEPGGLLFHALWYGEDDEQHHGMLFTGHTPETLGPLLPPELELVEHGRYREFKDGDSFWVVLRQRQL